MYFDLEGIPELSRGEVIEFTRPVDFGDFKARRFVVQDGQRLLFFANDENGPLVKILPTNLRVLAWRKLMPGPVPVEPVPAPVLMPELTFSQIALF